MIIIFIACFPLLSIATLASGSTLDCNQNDTFSQIVAETDGEILSTLGSSVPSIPTESQIKTIYNALKSNSSALTKTGVEIGGWKYDCIFAVKNHFAGKHEAFKVVVINTNKFVFMGITDTTECFVKLFLKALAFEAEMRVKGT